MSFSIACENGETNRGGVWAKADIQARPGKGLLRRLLSHACSSARHGPPVFKKQILECLAIDVAFLQKLGDITPVGRAGPQVLGPELLYTGHVADAASVPVRLRAGLAVRFGTFCPWYPL